MEMLEFVLLLLAAVLVSAVATRSLPRVVAVGADRAGRRHHLVGGHARRRGTHPALCAVHRPFAVRRIAACKQTWAVGQQGGHRVPLQSAWVLATVLVVEFRAELARAFHPRFAAAFALGAALGPHRCRGRLGPAYSPCPAVRNPCSPASAHPTPRIGRRSRSSSP